MTKKAQPSVKTTLMTAAALLAAFSSASAHAAADPLIDGARQCTQHFPIQEQRNGIPTHLLAAIATTESGRYHEGLGMNVPWPWTINVDGKGYFFNSKAEAVAQVQNLIAQGKQSIDVGCMQVNLKHHAKAFTSLSDAFDPGKNVAYAATFLHNNYGEMGDWIKATAAYHSRTPVHGARYLTNIERSWNRIVAKVASARATKNGEAANVALGPSTTTVAATPAATPARMPTVVVAANSRVMAEPRKSRVIQVRDMSTRNKGEVMVVRATPSAPVAEQAPIAVAQAPVAVAEAAPVAPLSIPVAAGDSVRRVNLDNRASSGVPKATSSTFVFAN